MPDVITATEYLEINSVPLATPAWRVLDLSPLWSLPDLAGADRPMPASVGSRPYHRDIVATALGFELEVFGSHNREGTPYATGRIGLQGNIDALLTAFEPPTTDPGTLSATWHRATGANKTAALHVIGFRPIKARPASIKFNLVVSIPAGRFT